MTTIQLVQLDKIIPSLLSPNPSQKHVRDFVYLCRDVAFAYLQMKVHRGKLDPNHFGISLEDLALDCVAPLFERNEYRRFIELASYFGNSNFTTMSSEELLGLTRRLVFSKVNEELFRLYKEHDPSLSNIIRNIRNALKFSRTLIPVVRNNETWIQLFHPDSILEGLPILPAEIIEARLLAQLARRNDLRHILDLLAEILSEQDLYQKQYPLVGMAIIIRSLIVRSSWTSAELGDNSADLSTDEISRFIQLSIQKTRTSMKGSYIGKGKLNEKTFDSYFDCIAEILEAEYILNDGMDLSFYDVMHKRAAEMSVSEYRCHHRVYLEYLTKLTRINFLESIKRELMVP